MIKGTPGEWYADGQIGGYFDKYGNLIVYEEYGTDADLDTYATEVQNGDGYYDDDGKFVRFKND